MDKNKKGLLKGVLIAVGVISVITGALVVASKVLSKFFKVKIEIGPDEDELDSDECPCDECNKPDEIEFDVPSDEGNGADKE